MDNSEFVGKTVLSSDFGVGKVVDIDNLGMGERLFLVIEVGESSMKSFIPLEEKSSYRFITDLKDLEGKLKGLNSIKVNLDFASKKDRINYFKTESRKQELDVVFRLLAELNSLKDRGSMENQIHTKLIDSIALEYMTLMQNSEDEAKVYVQNFLGEEDKA